MSYLLTVAKSRHIEDIYRMAKKSFNEGPEKGFPIVKGKMVDVISECVTSSHHLAVVVMVGGKVRGAILGMVEAHAYADGLIASDIMLYVHPSLRGTNCAADLVEVYSVWTSRIPNLLGSSLSLSRLGPTTPYMESLFRKHGYTKAGITYIRNTQ